MRDDIIYYYCYYYYSSYYWIFVVVVVVVVVWWSFVPTSKFLTDASRDTPIPYRNVKTHTHEYWSTYNMLHNNIPDNAAQGPRHRWWTSNGHRVSRHKMVFLRSKQSPASIGNKVTTIVTFTHRWRISRTNHRHSKGMKKIQTFWVRRIVKNEKLSQAHSNEGNDIIRTLSDPRLPHSQTPRQLKSFSWKYLAGGTWSSGEEVLDISENDYECDADARPGYSTRRLRIYGRG